MLKLLDLGNFHSFKELPLPIGGLHQLQKLRLGRCPEIEELPISMGN